MVVLIVVVLLAVAGGAAFFFLQKNAPTVKNFAPVIETAKAPMGFAWERTGMYDPQRTGYTPRVAAPRTAPAPAPSGSALNAPAPGGVALKERPKTDAIPALPTLPTAAPVVLTAFDTTVLKPSEVEGIKDADYTGLMFDGHAAVPTDASGKITFASAADRAEFVPVWSNISDETAFEDS